MNLSICQINPSLGDFKSNKEKILKYIFKSINLSANIIVFPELAICGYPPMDLIWEDGFIMENNLVLNEVARESTVPKIIGCIRAEKIAIYNSAAICFDGKLQKYCDKILLPNYDVFDEKRFFHSGQTPKVFKIPVNDRSRKIGIQICEDMWDNDYNCKVSKIQKEMGAELIINISASPFHENNSLKDL